MEIRQHTIDRIATGEEIHQMVKNVLRRMLCLPILRTSKQAYSETLKKYSAT